MVCYHRPLSRCANYRSPVQYFSLAALKSLAHLDTDSDSDVVPLPGIPTTQPYPNCCRWHLTEARCRYKWASPSICAPYAVRVGSTNQYSASEGTMTDALGSKRLHSPIRGISPAIEPGLPSPPVSLNSLPPSHELPPPSSPISSPPLSRASSASPPHASSQSPLATQSQRWYAVTKGRSICVVCGW